MASTKGRGARTFGHQLGPCPRIVDHREYGVDRRMEAPSGHEPVVGHRVAPSRSFVNRLCRPSVSVGGGQHHQLAIADGPGRRAKRDSREFRRVQTLVATIADWWHSAQRDDPHLQTPGDLRDITERTVGD